MNRQTIFPTQTVVESLSEPSIKLEGQKVVFDKKVSLLPIDVRKEDRVTNTAANGKSGTITLRANGTR